ncbi:ribonuclease HIII [Spiroplasma taiwanense]|uniref:Ribonuclease n=1 Tax=Spiroplasma taiwanense CT-1 TaxID=1276220 RepID=S5MCI8_9MOLU|nr:ribonuclease HIII [Spiroplasma taiwanense]AGR41438.1 ribonuclease HIII [Spiroplasma taiwanense CT-1]
MNSFKNVEISIINTIIKDNKKFLISKNNNANIRYFFRLEDNTVINIYNNKTILFQGKSANLLANKYNLLKDKNLINKIVNNKIIELPNIGCDEVGVGDFFGPLVTCACYLDKDFEKNNLNLINMIKDSKTISNEKIEKLFFQLKDKVKFSVYIMKNKEYNEKYTFYKNTHFLKAIAHNNSLKKVIELNNDLKTVPIIMDQFVNENKYFYYLEKEKDIVKNIYFQTKAESKYLAVACASIIARYFFLSEIENLQNTYKIKLPLGAGNNVKLFVQKYKKEFKVESINFIKLHFNDEIKKKI